MQKQCSKCLQDLDLNSFSSRGKERLHSACKDCCKKYSKSYYPANKSKWAIRNRNQTRKLANLIQVIKKDKACFDCNKTYPYYVMEFDHIKGVKINSISRMRTCGSWEKILKEIDKCELVCANCHRERTWNRLRKQNGVTAS